LISDTKAFTKVTGKDGFVRSFYEVFKAHAGSGCVDRIFITGVTSLTLDSLTSGFNIAKNISMFPELNEMVGFTTEEAKYLLQEVNTNNIEETMEILAENYNGYRFCKSAENKVFNSNMVLYFIDEYQRTKGIPDQLADPNMNNESLETDIISNFDFSAPFEEDDFLSLR